MALLIHIVIALASVAYTTYVYMSPSSAKLKGSYALVAATLVTGFFLVASQPAHIREACTSGLMYIGVMSFGLVAAHRKLAAEADEVKTDKE